MSLYEELGGKETFAVVVDEFYKRVLADSSLSYLFQNTDMDEQRKHLAAFVAFAAGGPEYKGRGMKEAHQSLGITNEQFGSVARHLVETLQFLNVKQEHIDAILGKVAPLQSAIVSK